MDRGSMKKAWNLSYATDEDTSDLVSNSVALPGQPDEELAAATDSEMLIRLAFESNPKEGCELLYRHYYQALCSHAIRFVYSRSVAEDLVSDILCQFYIKGTYKGITTSYHAFLYRSVRNRAYNHLRLQANRAVEFDSTYEKSIQATNQQPDSILEYEELCQEVEAVIQSLPAKCRKIYLMHRFDEKKYAQIAEELQLSARTVEVQIRKASQLVKKALTKYWVLLAVLLING
jgi:RNA polymerase sigma-70 factor (ECF subfamily)